MLLLYVCTLLMPTLSICCQETCIPFLRGSPFILSFFPPCCFSAGTLLLRGPHRVLFCISCIFSKEVTFGGEDGEARKETGEEQ